MTPTLSNENDDRPRLEFYPVNSDVLRTVVIAQYPFVIGRGEEAKLKIHSTSASREHASLTRTDEGFHLKDLGSTNGTVVNGEPIDEVLLEDGDAIRIGEMELTFRCAAAKSLDLERMVTQPLRGKQVAGEGEKCDFLSTQRALSEILLWQTIPLCRSSVIDCNLGMPQATMVSIGEPFASMLRGYTSCAPHSTASRTQQLAWMIAVQRADDFAAEGTLFLRLDLHAGLDRRLYQSIGMAMECLTGNRSLGVLFPWEWATQSLETIELCAALKSLGVQMAYDDFTGSVSCIDNMEQVMPDLLVLSPAVARGSATNPRMVRNLDRIVSHCNDSTIRLVIPAGLSEEDHRELRSLGVGFALSKDEKQNNLTDVCPVAVTA